jgi:hypothetical protein
MGTVQKLLRKISVFDFVLLCIGVFLFFGFFFFFYRKAEYVNIRVKVTDQDVLYAKTQPETWYANRFEVGDVERDTLGRVISEIVGVERFNVTSRLKAVYLDLKVRATYDTRTKLYSARGKPLIFGTPVRFNFSTITFDGIVTEFPKSEYQKNLRVENMKVVVLQRWIRPDGVTVEPTTIQSIKKGDKIYNSSGEVLAEVLEVKIRQAERTVETDKGELLLRYDPIYKDGIYTLNIRARVFNDEPFVFDNIPVKLGEVLPLNFPDVSLFPVIVEIQSENP